MPTLGVGLDGAAPIAYACAVGVLNKKTEEIKIAIITAMVQPKNIMWFFWALDFINLIIALLFLA